MSEIGVLAKAISSVFFESGIACEQHLLKAIFLVNRI